MSLINDALQRAKEVQQSQPAAGSRPELRPAVAAPAHPGSRLMLPVLFASLLVAGVFVWIQFHSSEPATVARPLRAPEASAVRPGPAPAPTTCRC